MRLRSFSAPTLEAAQALVVEALGPRAAILAANRNAEGGIDVLAADAGRTSIEPDTPAPASFVPPERRTDAIAQAALAFHNAPGELSAAVTQAVRNLGIDEPAAALAQALESLISFRPPPASPSTPILLVGPPGSGKTSAAAKLAARAALAGLPIDLAVADDHRPSAVEAVRRYADLLGARFIDATGSAGLNALADARDPGRTLFIDGPAANPFAPDDLRALRRLVRLSDAEPVAVLDAGATPGDAADAARAFADAGCSRFIAAKVDAARRRGAILAAADTGLALACVSASPFIGGGLSPATPLRLARLLLDDALEFAASAEAAT